MAWFESNVFKANWFASRWWTYVTVPVTTISSGVGGGMAIDWGIPIFETEMCNLFDGQQGREDLQLQEIQFDSSELMDDWNPRPRSPKRKFIKPVAKKKSVRNLDTIPARSIRRIPSGKSECSLCRFPSEMRDIFGEMEVVDVFCVSRDNVGATVRHLG